MASVSRIAMAGVIVLMAMTGVVWGGGAAFDKLDKNKDGRLDLKELDEPAQAIFKQYDRNGDGYLTAAEFKKIKEARSSFTDLDANHDGKIDLSELKQAAARRFMACDANRDGFLDKAEMDACMAQGAREGSPAFARDKEKRIGQLDRPQGQAVEKEAAQTDRERALPSSPRSRPGLIPLFSIYF